MTGNGQNILLKKLLLHSQNKGKLWAALGALCVGSTLFLLSVLVWSDFNTLLNSQGQGDSLGSTYLTLGKKVTDQNMGVPMATLFTPQDIENLKAAPQVQDVGVVTSNRFPVYAMMGGNLAFATELPLESVPDKFIDNLPKDWQWQPGNNVLPIIISSQFLDLYNYVFAPSQGLPQLSESSVKSLSLRLKVGGDQNGETMMAHVVGFSGRIGSVLAPQSFIDYGNAKFGQAGLSTSPSQLILKTKDPSDTKFTNYLAQNNYNTNPQNLRWSKVRAIVDVVTLATGILACLLMGIGTLVIVLFIELTIAKAQHSLTLLLELGYGPNFLGSFMTKQFMPKVLATAFLSLLLTVLLQAIVALIAPFPGLEVPFLPGWQIWVGFVISTSILVAMVKRAIDRAIGG